MRSSASGASTAWASQKKTLASSCGLCACEDSRPGADIPAVHAMKTLRDLTGDQVSALMKDGKVKFVFGTVGPEDCTKTASQLSSRPAVNPGNLVSYVDDRGILAKIIEKCPLTARCGLRM